MARFACLLATGVLLTACTDVPAASIRGEVRGMPVSLTAYSRVLQMPEDSLAGAVSRSCDALRDSMATIPGKVRDMWSMLEAESDRRIDKACRAASDDTPMCGFGDRVRSGIVLELAQNGVPSGMHTSGTMQLEVQQVRQYATTYKRELVETYRRQFSETLHQYLVSQDTSVQVLEVDGRFEVVPRDSALRAVVMVRSAETFQFAALSAEAGSPAQVIAYDEATFGPFEKCPK